MSFIITYTILCHLLLLIQFYVIYYYLYNSMSFIITYTILCHLLLLI